MKIAAVVILYHPAIDAISNIKTYYDWVDSIFVFDNTQVTSEIKDELLQLPKIRFYHDFRNEGIAKRLNTACALAAAENFDWILTMDQDSGFSATAISTYLDCFHNFKNKPEVAMFGVRFSRNNERSTSDCEGVQAEKLITSGSLLNLSLFATIGPFDENLFIDAVDYDYCFRAKMAGFSLVRFSNVILLHTVGNEVYRSSIKTLFLLKKKKEVHSPLRCYYMYRNMLYLQQKYKGQEAIYAKEIRDYVRSRIKVSLLYGRNAKQILQYVRKARLDFKSGHMGKIG